MKTKNKDLIMQNKIFLWIALATGLLLLIPLIWEWPWTLFDFVFAGILLFGTGSLFVLVARKAHTAAYRYAVGVALATAFLLIWINAAVGIIGEDEWPNLMYFGVLLIGFIGAFLSRFEPIGMVRTLVGMAIGQMVVPVVALVFAPHSMSETPGIAGVFGLSAIFALLFTFSALLFQRAASQCKSA